MTSRMMTVTADVTLICLTFTSFIATCCVGLGVRALTDHRTTEMEAYPDWVEVSGFAVLVATSGRLLGYPAARSDCLSELNCF